MTGDLVSIWVVLVAAYTVVEFGFDVPRRFGPERGRVGSALVHAASGYVLLGSWTAWPVPLTLVLAHLVVHRNSFRDGRSTAKAFLARQAAHLLVLTVLAWILVSRNPPPLLFWRNSLDFPPYARVLSMIAGFLLCVRAGSELVALLVAPYLRELEVAISDSSAGDLVRPGGWRMLAV